MEMTSYAPYDRHILDGLRWLVRELRLSSLVAEETAGVSGAQLFALSALVAEPGLAVGELAERTLTHQSSVSVVVSRLEQRGLVERRRSPSDGRRVELYPTDAGRACLDAAPPVAQQRLLAAIGTLDGGDRRALANGLTRLVRAMGRGGPPPMFFEPEGAP